MIIKNFEFFSDFIFLISFDADDVTYKNCDNDRKLL